MQYFITFLEGIISFISPCMLPMLPLYISYFAAESDTQKRQKGKTLICALAFVLGFTVVFSLLGLFAGTLGSFLSRYKTVLHLISGIIVILLGLSFLQIIPLPFLKGMKKAHRVSGALSAFIFGIVFSVSLTPCIGAFLGSALMLASVSESSLKGLTLLITYSLGLGIPFLISAILIDKLKTTFQAIQKHSRLINIICGVFLIAIGMIMACGLWEKFLGLFS